MDLYITDTQLTKGGVCVGGVGQRCISWFWLGTPVLNSHGSPCGSTQGWWEFEIRVFLYLSPSSRRAGRGEEKKKTRGEWDVSKCESCAKNSRRTPVPLLETTRLSGTWGWHQKSNTQKLSGWQTEERDERSEVGRQHRCWSYSDIPGCFFFYITRLP